MRKSYEYEVSRLKKYRIMIFIYAFLTQLLSLYFFTIIGRFDNTDENSVLRNYTTLSGLATTICMCILVVYGTVVINRFLVTNYIGENKTRLYLYPVGRSQLFYTKVTSFCGTFFLFQFLGITLSNAFYLISETFSPILLTSELVYRHLPQFMTISLAGVILTISIILLSSVAGIHLNSTLATIVTGIIFVVICGNILAMALASHLVITLSATILVIIITYIFIKITGTRIENDEVISK